MQAAARIFSTQGRCPPLIGRACHKQAANAQAQPCPPPEPPIPVPLPAPGICGAAGRGGFVPSTHRPTVHWGGAQGFHAGSPKLLHTARGEHLGEHKGIPSQRGGRSTHGSPRTSHPRPWGPSQLSRGPRPQTVDGGFGPLEAVRSPATHRARRPTPEGAPLGGKFVKFDEHQRK